MDNSHLTGKEFRKKMHDNRMKEEQKQAKNRAKDLKYNNGDK